MRVTIRSASTLALKQNFAVRNQVRIPDDDLLPGRWCPVLRDFSGRKAELFRWGISETKMGQGSRLVFAFKVENLVSVKHEHLLERRVLIPVESFTVADAGKILTIRHREDTALALAGIWDIDGHWRGRPVHAFRIISGPTVEGMEHLGSRMPLVLNPSNWRSWLWHFTDKSDALDALEPYTELKLS